jgi:hypothetical protein
MPPSEPSRAEALFTGLRGSRILGNLLAGSCIDPDLNSCKQPVESILSGPVNTTTRGGA